MMTDREQYTPGPASGAQVRKDGEKWTRRSSVQICPPQPFNSLIHKGLPTRVTPSSLDLGAIGRRISPNCSATRSIIFAREVRIGSQRQRWITMPYAPHLDL
jgi:hypothetical protein